MGLPQFPVNYPRPGHEGDSRNAFRYIVSAYEGEPLFVLRGRDLLSLPAVTGYSLLCGLNGLADTMVPQVERHIKRFANWQEANPSKLKYPDPYPSWER